MLKYVIVDLHLVCFWYSIIFLTELGQEAQFPVTPLLNPYLFIYFIYFAKKLIQFLCVPTKAVLHEMHSMEHTHCSLDTY